MGRNPSAACAMLVCDFDFTERFGYADCVAGPDQARDFAAVVQEYQCRPEFDVEGAPQWTTPPIGDLDVAQGWIGGERSRQQRLGRATVAACRAAKFK